MEGLLKHKIKNGEYSESDIGSNFDIIYKIDDCIVAIRELSESWIEFVVGSFAYSEDNSVVYDIFWNGCGTSEPLRELRHSWFGDENGYIFYVNKEILTDAIKILSKYFDMD